MLELKYLYKLANLYETKILKFCLLKDFYSICCNNKEYEKIKNYVTKNLHFVGSGSCNVVFKKNHYVLKLHTPYNEKISLLCEPNKKILNLSKKYKLPCKKNFFFDCLALEYFLFYEFVTPNGLAGIQKFIDCNKNAQLKARYLFNQINPGLTRINHIRNYGLHNGKPFYVDWN